MNHILIVDDEAEIRESSRRDSARGGLLRCERGHGGGGPLAQARDPVYDVLLLDIWLPDRDAWKF